MSFIVIFSVLHSHLQGFSGPLSQKSDENPRMRVIPHSKFPPKCAHAPILVAFFVTTDLKNPVHGIIECMRGEDVSLLLVGNYKPRDRIRHEV